MYAAVVTVIALISAAQALPRGVDPAQADAYSGAGGVFTCLDGSATIPFDRVNDNYCDCPGDGSDEPGTSACYYGKFYCPNRGHQPQTLHSSFVDDGICDCCDGSDEKGSLCKNTCLDKGAHERQAVRDKAQQMERSLGLKEQLVKEGLERQARWSQRATEIPQLLAEQEKEIARLESEKAAAQKAAEEDKKRLQAEAEERRKQEEVAAAEAAAKAAEQQAESAGSGDAAGSAGDAHEETDEERGRRIAAQWTNDPAAAGVPAEEQDVEEGFEEEDTGSHHTDYEGTGAGSASPAADPPAPADPAPTPAPRKKDLTLPQYLALQWEEFKASWHREVADAKAFASVFVSAGKELGEMLEAIWKGGMPEYQRRKTQRHIAARQARQQREQAKHVDPEVQAARDRLSSLLSTLQAPGMDPAWQEEGRKMQAEWYLASATGSSYTPSDEQRALLEKVAAMQEAQAAGAAPGQPQPEAVSSTPSPKRVRPKKRRPPIQQQGPYHSQTHTSAPDVYSPLEADVQKWTYQVDSARAKLTELRDELAVVHRYHTSGIKYDFGPDNAFLPLAGRCIAETNNRWRYEACFFSHATQSEPHNMANKVSLGQWSHWDNDYTEAVFVNGDPCQGAPNRSFRVRFVCGETEQMWGGEEPSTCVYTANLATPLACRESDLEQEYDKLAALEKFEAEIRAEIDAAEKAKVNVHDEL